MRALQLLLLAGLFAGTSALDKIIDLSEEPWELSNSNGSIIVNAPLPGYVHTALEKNKIIPDPLYRFGDTELRWIAKEAWNYTRSFKLSAEVVGAAEIFLELEGADTVCTVMVNNRVLRHVANQHDRFRLDVKSFVREGENTLSLRFDSAILAANALAKAYPYEVPPLAKGVDPVTQGEGARQFLRKAGCDFAWDWGPCFAPMGVSRAVVLHAFDGATLRHAAALPAPSSQDTLDGEWMVNVDVVFYAAARTSGTLEATLELANCSSKCTVSDSWKLDLPAGETTLTRAFTVNSPALWWPRGLNRPVAQLHPLTITWTPKGSSRPTITDNLRVGFRSIHLTQNQIAGVKEGLSFELDVNGHKTFAKGVNWIPAHVFHDKVTNEYLGTLLQSCCDANMNIVRIWGGGIYQDDQFYNYADEMGLMIWQEFMFACAMYPTDPILMDEVRSEATFQIRRLKKHPAVMLWSGNNENEQALVQDWYGTSENRTLYNDDYRHLYIDVLSPIVHREDSSRPFLPSSPSNGDAEKDVGYISENPQSEFWGDLHYYNYDADCWNVSSYMTPRMASEYGVQSLPSLHTWRTVSKLEDWDLWSPLVAGRQHHPLGNIMLENNLKRHWPTTRNGSREQHFDDTIYLSQLAQAMCVLTETEHYRRSMGTLDSEGRGHTMGTLYWQLNDVWQAPSWSSLELGGRWKALHYFVRHMYADLLVSPYRTDNDDLSVFVINDNLDTKRTDLTLEVQTWSWTDGLLRKASTELESIPPSSSTEVYNKPISSLIKAAKAYREDAFFLLRILDQSTEVVRHPFFPTYPKDIPCLPLPGLSVSVHHGETDGTLLVTVHAKRVPAAFVWLDTSFPGRFSDNAFLLEENTRTIEFYPRDKVSAQQLEKSLQVRSLADAVDRSAMNCA